MRQFDIWWADLPMPIGRRPVLILTRTRALKYLSKCVVAEVTTIVRNIAVEVPLGRDEGLPAKCVANLDNVHAVPIGALVDRAGSLHPRRYTDVKRALGHAFEWDELISSD